jgi:hypothetical protein
LGTSSAEYVIETSSVLESTVYGEYTNTTGSNPTFTVDSATVPAEFDSDPATASTDGSDVTIGIGNISIFANETSYYLQSVVAEEEISGTWFSDSENPVAFSNLTDITGHPVRNC